MRLTSLRLFQAMLLLFGLLALREGMLPVCILALLVMLISEGRVRLDSRRQANVV